MSALKRLQAEIDKVMKKVDEGIAVFEDIWEKLHETEHQSQKEKFETELKKEIKKLQRQREQIKGWISSTDVKDKNSLLEARKRIERKMEQFKATEKEMKTKAFSREGLNQAGRLDPKERERARMRDWLNGACDTLTTQIDEFEADIEAAEAGASGRKRGAANVSDHTEQMEEHVRRHKEHIARLEQVLRCLDSGDVTPEEVADIQDLVDDYLERCVDDFDEFADTDMFYEGLADKLDAVAQGGVGVVGNNDDDEAARAEEERRRERERAAAAAAKAQLAAQNAEVAARQEAEEASAVKMAAEGKTAPVVVARVRGGSSPPRARGTSGPPESPGVATSQPSGSIPSTPAPSASVSYGAIARGGQSSPSASPAAVAPVQAGPWRSQAPKVAVAVKSGGTPDGRENSRGEGADAAPVSARLGGLTLEGGAPSPSAAAGQQPQQPQQAVTSDAAAAGGRSPQPGAGGGVAPAPLPSGAPPASAVASAAHAQMSLKILQATYPSCMPRPRDSEWPAIERRQQRLPAGLDLPASYPRQRIPQVQNPLLYERVDPELLFLAFYLMPGTYQQHLAAKQLKKQSWRYHKQHQSWFQRHDAPRSITDDHETGSYVYFDHTAPTAAGGEGWCYRVRHDLKIEYAVLENEL
ncbi:unnamed protein product [Pedinophyceae sp. YPF-701]|nr:unnamed protein product [Pedinophyceae sp. YPF-701]